MDDKIQTVMFALGIAVLSLICISYCVSIFLFLVAYIIIHIVTTRFQQKYNVG